jgi:transcriptional regulator with XRE-family HTH domain
MSPSFGAVKPELYFSFSILYIPFMIISAQIRAARGLLKWTQALLAHKAAISVVTLNMIESDNVDPRASTLRAIEAVLEKAGVEFIGNEREGLGVRLRPSRRR